MGTQSSWASSFSKQTTIGVAFTGTLNLGSNTASWTQTTGTFGSITIDKSSSESLQVPGPANSDLGIDHDYDQIAVWVNPQATFSATSSNGANWEWNFDPRDPAGEVDVQYLYVTWLRNPSTIPPGVAQVLARTWAGSGQGLTTADYNSILLSDPFWNLGTTPPTNISTTRFDLEGGSTFPYEPPACGGQPDTKVYNQAYSRTSVQGQAAEDQYNVTYSRGFSLDFGNWIGLNVDSSTSLTWTNEWSQQTTQQVGQTASLSITGPSDCHYAGGTDVQVYQDNVYGTFMFAFTN
jgi:hypothetical protein